MKIKRWMVMDVNPETGQVKDVENKIIETRGMMFYRKINNESYLISMIDPVRKVFDEEFGGVVDGIHLYLDLEKMNIFLTGKKVIGIEIMKNNENLNEKLGEKDM